MRNLLPSGRNLITLDALLALWAFVWILLAVEIYSEVRGLADLSTTVSRVGGAVQQSGEALSELDGLPLGLGDRLSEPAARIEEAGRSAVESGRSSRESVESLSTLLAIAIGVIPSLPLLGFYLPLRLGIVRERRALQRAAARAQGDPAFEEFLARRAVENLPLARLRELSPEPWRDLAEGRHRELACAELSRLGIDDSVLRPSAGTRT